MSRVKPTRAGRLSAEDPLIKMLILPTLELMNTHVPELQTSTEEAVIKYASAG